MPLLRALPVDVMSIDRHVALGEAAAALGPGFALQGNLAPEVLLKSVVEIEAAVGDILRQGRSAASHIFNLGHGILPGTDPQSVRSAVEAVHRLGRREQPWPTR
ncbi:MAG TPA: hypothetical protein DEB40_14255 [Elusimicrobia bacterium]|nr:hypothetical protein [Elusimicrobiota bacterium]